MAVRAIRQGPRRRRILVDDEAIGRIASAIRDELRAHGLRLVWSAPDRATPDRIVDIYALCDPDTSEIRYVGRSVDAEDRFVQHMRKDARTPFPSAKERWIAELAAVGKEPTLKILEVVPARRQREAEAAWIGRAREQGHRLTNTAKP